MYVHVYLERNLDFRGWNSHLHRDFPGNLESRNFSREILSRATGRTPAPSLSYHSNNSSTNNTNSLL